MVESRLIILGGLQSNAEIDSSRRTQVASERDLDEEAVQMEKKINIPDDWWLLVLAALELIDAYLFISFWNV